MISNINNNYPELQKTVFKKPNAQQAAEDIKLEKFWSICMERSPALKEKFEEYKIKETTSFERVADYVRIFVSGLFLYRTELGIDLKDLGIDLKDLGVLDLSNANITEIPKEFYLLKGFSELNISQNQIKEFDFERVLKNWDLKKLDASNNQINYFQFDSCGQLERNNPFNFIDGLREFFDTPEAKKRRENPFYWGYQTNPLTKFSVSLNLSGNPLTYESSFKYSIYQQRKFTHDWAGIAILGSAIAASVAFLRPPIPD
jgi:hypothetical protein